VSAAVEAHAELGNAATIAKTVSNTYNVRSTLVHDGTADESAVSEGLTFLSDFIPRLLKALFVQTAA
jgi:hypothetical protein